MVMGAATVPRPRFGARWPELGRWQVVALSGVIARELAAEPDKTVNGLAATVAAAKDIVSHYPDLDAIERCYTAPGDGCLCNRGDFPHLSEPGPVPEWVSLARDERDAALITLTAISETVALAAGQPPGQGDEPAAPRPLPGGSMSHALAAGNSQRRHTLGVQRRYYDLEGHHHRRAPRDTISGDRHRPPEPPPEPPPPPPEPEPGRKPRRRRRRLR
jgi:hypothetical protein